MVDEGLRTIVCVHCRRSRQEGYQRYCGETGRRIQEHARDGACPLELYVADNLPPGISGRPLTPEQQAAAARQAQEAAAKLAEAGRLLWAELHTQRKPTPDWWAGWLSRVGKLGCACRGDFAKILAAAPPPPFDDPVAFFAWGVERHNDVNAALKKSVYPRERAAAQWWPEIA